MQGKINCLLKYKGLGEPLDIDMYMANDGYKGLKTAVDNMSKDDILDEVDKAVLLGRGGAAYPAGRKWKQLMAINTNPKYIVCNADEGEPGTFKDRDLIKYCPYGIIEGMTIAGYVFDSPRGFIYIRGEYRTLQQEFQKALDIAKAKGLLGKNILGKEGFDFDITIVSGAGAYVCGENSALLNSIEGKPGRPRVKPPHLAEVGLYSLPTLVNNVESFSCIPVIMRMGGDAFREMGTETSGGTKLITICGHAKNKGVYEVGLGTSLKDILYSEEYGGGTTSGMPIKFVHFGGQSGPIGFPEQFDIPYDYDSMKKAGLAIGSGAIVVMDESVSLVEYCMKVTEFFVHESCGKCTPCRIGTERMLEIFRKLIDRKAVPEDIDKLKELGDMIRLTAACGLGQANNVALNNALAHSRYEFESCCKRIETWN